VYLRLGQGRAKPERNYAARRPIALGKIRYPTSGQKMGILATAPIRSSRADLAAKFRRRAERSSSQRTT